MEYKEQKGVNIRKVISWKGSKLDKGNEDGNIFESGDQVSAETQSRK